MYFKLVMMNPDNKPGRDVPLKTGDTIIGRTKGCKIRISAHEVSRKHCRVRINGDTVFVKDLGSANGTRVNGNLVAGDYVLRPSDRLSVGPVTFILDRGTGPTPPDSASVDVMALIEQMTTGLPATPGSPATVSNMEPVTFVDYPKPAATPAADAAIPSAIVEDLPVAEPDEPSAVATAPAPTPENLPSAELDEPPLPAAPAAAQPAPEDELPYADLDNEAPDAPPAADGAKERQIAWLLSDEKQ